MMGYQVKPWYETSLNIVRSYPAYALPPQLPPAQPQPQVQPIILNVQQNAGPSGL